MDVTALDQGAWFDFKLKGKTLRLKLRPATDKEKVGIGENFKDTKVGLISAVFAPFVMDWDLTRGGDPLPCDDENKAHYLGFYMLEELEPDPVPMGEEPKPTVQVWARVLEIVKGLDFFSLG